MNKKLQSVLEKSMPCNCSQCNYVCVKATEWTVNCLWMTCVFDESEYVYVCFCVCLQHESSTNRFDFNSTGSLYQGQLNQISCFWKLFSLVHKSEKILSKIQQIIRILLADKILIICCIEFNSNRDVQIKQKYHKTEIVIPRVKNQYCISKVRKYKASKSKG